MILTSDNGTYPSHISALRQLDRGDVFNTKEVNQMNILNSLARLKRIHSTSINTSLVHTELNQRGGKTK